MRNYFIESSEYNPWKNLAIEKHLADAVQSGDLLFYLWQNEKTVVIGRNQNALRECKADLLEAEGGYLARRTTGGGAVYQDTGNLCFTFLASPERYDLERQMKVIGEACRTFGIETEFSGRNDIVTKDGYKFSGNAFSVNKKCKIQHGTLMIDVKKENLMRYLTPSEEKMKAKGVRSVESRVCNLKELNPAVTVEAMKEALKTAFERAYGEYERIGLVDDVDGFRETYDLYASWDWRYGKSPECETTLSKRFSWGEIQIHLRMKHLHIEECKVYSDALDVELPMILEGLLTGKRYDLNDVDLGEKLEITETQLKQVKEVFDWIKTTVF